MTPTVPPRQFTDATLASWAITLACAVLLWSVGYWGPYVCLILFGLSLLGGVFLFGKGLYGIRNTSAIISIVNLLIGVGASTGVGIFAFQVLSNEEGAIAVAGQEIYPRDDGRGNPLPAPKKIRLFNLNVLHGYPDFEKQNERFNDTVTELRRHDPDIVVLQEAWMTSKHGSMAGRLAESLGFNYAYARANGSFYHIGFEEGSAILSRFPITGARRILLKPRRPWWENRIALITNLVMNDGRCLTVVGVHASYTSPDEQAEYLMEFMKHCAPDIVAGDFNAEPKSRAMTAIVEQGFVEAIPRNDSAEPWIDHVFLSPAFHTRWEAKETSWIIATLPVSGVRGPISDHDGILVDLSRR